MVIISTCPALCDMEQCTGEMADSQTITAGSRKLNEVKLTMKLPFDIIYVVQFSFDKSSWAGSWTL